MAMAMDMGMGMGMGSTFGKSTDFEGGNMFLKKSQNWLAWWAKHSHTLWESCEPLNSPPSAICCKNQKNVIICIFLIYSLYPIWGRVRLFAALCSLGVWDATLPGVLRPYAASSSTQWRVQLFPSGDRSEGLYSCT